jgi:flagellar protein FliO/FliZ
MQAFSWLTANKALAYGAAALALVVAALLILLVFRLAFGRRLRMSGRGRQLRLGIVDAFDLDRQRQLVIVRRDNVEHLIMIGGPNDVLIESQIIRAEARDSRLRDKEREHREKDFSEAVQLPPVQPLKPAGEPQLPLAPFLTEMPAAAEPARSPPSTTQPPAPAPIPGPSLQPAARTPLPSVSPRRTPPRSEPPRPESKPATPAPQVEKPAEFTPPAPEALTTPAPVVEAVVEAPPQPAKPAAAGLMRWRPGQASGTQPRPSGPSFTQPLRPSSEPAPARAATPPSPTPESETPAVTQPAAEDLMISLEEEMAKLLGRTPDKH